MGFRKIVGCEDVRMWIEFTLNDMLRNKHINPTEKGQFEIEANKVVDNLNYAGGKRPRDVAMAAIALVSDKTSQMGCGIYRPWLGKKMLIGSIPYFADLYGNVIHNKDGVGDYSINSVRKVATQLKSDAQEKFGVGKVLTYEAPRLKRLYF